MRRAALRILARWKVDPSAQAVLVGSSDQDATSCSDEEKLALTCIVDIHAQLRLIFGASDRAYTWMGAPNVAFSGMSALDLIEREGVAGLALVFGCLAEIGSGIKDTDRSS